MRIKKNKTTIYIILGVLILAALVVYIYLSFFSGQGAVISTTSTQTVTSSPYQINLTPEEAARKTAIISRFENQSPQQMNQSAINRKLAVLQAVQAH